MYTRADFAAARVFASKRRRPARRTAAEPRTKNAERPRSVRTARAFCGL